MTTNQYYRGLRKRFDRRAALLHRFGFKYTVLETPVEQWGKPAMVAVFQRGRNLSPQVIPVAVLHHASNFAWIMYLRDTLKLAT